MCLLLFVVWHIVWNNITCCQNPWKRMSIEIVLKYSWRFLSVDKEYYRTCYKYESNWIFELYYNDKLDNETQEIQNCVNNHTDITLTSGHGTFPALRAIWIHRSPADSPHKGPVTQSLVFSCHQAALRTFLSVRLSVCLSVRPSVTPFSQCSCHRIIMRYYYRQKWRPCKSSRSEIKGLGHWGQNKCWPNLDVTGI